MNERNFNGLIVRHRKSAVFFERVGNLENIRMYEPYIQWGDGKETIRGEAIPHYERSELDVGFDFDEQERKELLEYLKQIGREAWTLFEPKEADSMRAEYDSYWDKDIEDEGNLSISNNNRRGFLCFSAPFQPARKDGTVRLYKFNKRKFESFIYDLHKALDGDSDGKRKQNQHT